jgi:hypothetical protein
MSVIRRDTLSGSALMLHVGLREGGARITHAGIVCGGKEEMPGVVMLRWRDII